MVHSMVAHQDAVTSLAVDPSGLYLLTGSKTFHSLSLLQQHFIKTLNQNCYLCW